MKTMRKKTENKNENECSAGLCTAKRICFDMAYKTQVKPTQAKPFFMFGGMGAFIASAVIAVVAVVTIWWATVVVMASTRAVVCIRTADTDEFGASALGVVSNSCANEIVKKHVSRMPDSCDEFVIVIGEECSNRCRPGVVTMILNAATTCEVTHKTNGVGWTALHVCAMHGCEAGCEVLVQRGANPCAASVTGITPIDIAHGNDVLLHIFSLNGATCDDRVKS